MSTASLLFLSVLSALTVMNLAYVICRKINNVALVDVAWSYGVGLLALLLVIIGEGAIWRRALVLLPACLWSLRLGTYLLKNRVLSGHEDGRYVALINHWGKNAMSRLFWFYQLQALFIFLFALPFYPIVMDPDVNMSIWDIIALLVWAVAVAGESIADNQLARWRANPENKNRTCNKGLWRYSRHPNYFFEWMHWWTYVLMGAGAPLFWLTLLGPVLMFLFLYRITGIPYTEAQALRKRPEDYARYQRTTSAFFPWFPKEDRL